MKDTQLFNFFNLNNEEDLKGVNIKNIFYDNTNFKILNYNKEEILKDINLISTIGKLRSVVLDDNNKVLSYSPPKSLRFETFLNKNPIKKDFIVAEEFIEGTMINLFYIESQDKWEISTKTSIGGNYNFFNKTITFRDMFFETLNMYINTNFNILNKNYCYSFVLQHPKNRIVTKFRFSKLFLIDVYCISETNIVNITDLYENNECFLRPKIENNWETYEDLIRKYNCKNTLYTTMGVVIKNKNTGERAKIRNPSFEVVRQLRGNQINLQYQYLLLRKNGNVNEFLKYFPEYSSQLLEYRKNIHNITKTLFSNYVECYIRKEKVLSDYSYPYKNHMYELHQHYLKNLKPSKQYINFYETVNYVNGLHPSQQMSFITFNLRTSSPKSDEGEGEVEEKVNKRLAEPVNEEEKTVSLEKSNSDFVMPTYNG